MSKLGLETGLSKLIAPHTVEEFLTNMWPHEPLTVHGVGNTLSELTSIPLLQSVDSLLNGWPKSVQAHLPDIADESSSIDASPKDAKKLFENRMALLFNNVETVLPELVPWLNAIATDLGLPTSTHARCMAYATPHGKGTAAHFDQNINFVLQLRGTKTWWLAPNESVTNPTQRHTIGQPLDPELGSYLDAEMPDKMPTKNQIKVELKPGSVLFVPRGWWHKTSADGEALALNFTFSQPTWMDVFTLALKSRLSLSPEWRELANGVTSRDAETRENAEIRFDELLAELVYDLPNWRAADILGATEGTVGASEGTEPTED